MCEIILSYGWLAENSVLINPKRHGLLIPNNGRMIWVDGLLPTRTTTISMVQGMPIEILEANPMQSAEPEKTRMSKKQYHELVHQWEDQEKAS